MTCWTFSFVVPDMRRLLLAVWMLSCLILNLAFNSNLRATLLRPKRENPINSIQDAIERGKNIWVAHDVIDPSKPDEISQYYLEYVAHPDIKLYVESRGLTTFDINYTNPNFLPDHVLKDVMENGASFDYPVRFHF